MVRSYDLELQDLGSNTEYVSAVINIQIRAKIFWVFMLTTNFFKDSALSCKFVAWQAFCKHAVNHYNTAKSA